MEGDQNTLNTLLGTKHYTDGIAFWKTLEHSSSSKQTQKMFSTSDSDEHRAQAKDSSPQGREESGTFILSLSFSVFPAQLRSIDTSVTFSVELAQFLQVRENSWKESSTST